MHEGNKGGDVELLVSEHPIYLASVCSKETKEAYTYHYRQLIPREGWKDIIVQASVLYSGGGKGELHSKGANISDYSAFLTYTQAAVNMAYTNQEKVEPLYEQFGWKNRDTEFLYGLMLYSENGKRKVIGDKNVATRTGANDQVWIGPCRGGSLATWVDAADRLFAPGTETQSFAICASFGAIFQRFLVRGEGGSIISLVTHETGRGKSTAMAGATTVWGHRLGLGLEKIDSGISKGATIGAIGNLPLFHDQFQTMDPVKVLDFVDMFTNGRDKRRMARDGELADAGLQWQTTMFVASNASLIDSIESMGNAALARRIWEMSTEIPDHLKALYHGEKLRAIMEDNCGYAGDWFLSKLMSGNNLKIARDDVEKFYIDMSKRCNVGPEGRFWLRLGATAAVGAEIVAGNLLNFDAKRIMEWFEKEVWQRQQALPSEDDWPIEALGRFINEHNTCQLVVEKPFFPGDSNVTPHIKPTRELYIRKERQGGRVYISRDALQRWCVKKGINQREMINTLERFGCVIDKYKKMTLGAGTDYASTRIYTLAIDGYHKKLGGMFNNSADVLPFAPKEDDYSAGEQVPF